MERLHKSLVLVARWRHQWLHSPAKTWLLVTALILYSVFVLFFNIGSHGINNGNESLYVEAAREMLVNHDWLIPRLNDLPFLEKPPLLVWLLALSFSISGFSELAARAVPICATGFLMWRFYLYAKRLEIGASQFTATYILISSIGVVIMSRAAMPDILLTVLFACALGDFLSGIVLDKQWSVRVGALFLGLAALTKGFLPVLLIAMIALSYAFMDKEKRPMILRTFIDPWVLSLILVPVLLWAGVAEVSLPGTLKRFIVDEHILRFLGMREPHDYYSGPVTYYILRLFLFFFPWGGVLLFSWIAERRHPNSGRQAIRRFLWLSVWIPFIFFSLSSAKANYYILLCLPPLALLTAEYVPTLLRDHDKSRALLAVIIPVILIIAVMSLRAWLVLHGETRGVVSGPPDGSLWLAFAATGVVAIFVILLFQIGYRRVALGFLGWLALPALVQFDHIWHRAEPLVSAKAMAGYILAAHNDLPVYLYQDYEAYGSLPIYLGRNVPVIDSQSADLWYGKKLLPTHAAFADEAALINEGKEFLIVVLHDRENAFSMTRLHSLTEQPLLTIGDATLYRVKPQSKASLPTPSRAS